ncbi:MAG: hypothetical protein ACK4PR_07625 [Gammaproteobacteria bacterium]
MFTVSIEDIKLLNAGKLTKLMERLMILEADATGIPTPRIHVSHAINVADGGEDGRIEWEGGPTKTEFFPSRCCLFQCKATELAPADCKEEILTAFKTKKVSARLKLQVEAIFERNASISSQSSCQAISPEGSYVLFYGYPLNQKQIEERIKRFREALQDAGKPYAQTAKFLIIDGNQIAKWVNKYIAAIKAVYEFTGKLIPAGALTWDDWSGYKKFQYEYVVSSTREQIIGKIKRTLIENNRNIRVIGLSGLGKTRLALEIFRPVQNDACSPDLSKSVIYIDANKQKDIVSNLMAWRRDELRGIIIVDNCPLTLHDDLVEEANRSSLKLFTLNYEPSGIAVDTIKLERDTDDVISKILVNQYPWLKNNDLERVVQFAQGFPQLAVMMCEVGFQEDEHLAQIKDSELTKRLIWGRAGKNERAFKVISLCALFDSIPWQQEVKYRNETKNILHSS